MLRQQLGQCMTDKEAEFKEFERSLTYLHSIGRIRQYAWKPEESEESELQLPAPIEEVSLDSASPLKPKE